jgi:hypothetical protein
MAKPPYLEMGVVVSFFEIFNRAATLEGAREILSQYKREAVLLVLAKVSAALRIWFRPDSVTMGWRAMCSRTRAAPRPTRWPGTRAACSSRGWVCAGDGAAGPKRELVGPGRKLDAHRATTACGQRVAGAGLSKIDEA